MENPKKQVELSRVELKCPKYVYTTSFQSYRSPSNCLGWGHNTLARFSNGGSSELDSHIHDTKHKKQGKYLDDNHQEVQVSQQAIGVKQ